MSSRESVGPMMRPASESAQPESGRLSGNIGPVELAFTVLAYNGPVVVFLGFIPVAIGLGNGVGTPVAILACGAVIACLAVGLTAMARKLPMPGGFYAFITAGLGKVVGLGAGFAAVVSYYVACLSAYALGGIAMRALMSDLLHGPSLPWWAWSAAIFVVVSILGYLRIDLSAKVLAVFLGCELLFLAIYDVSVLVQGGADGLSLESFQPTSIFSGEVGIAIMFGMGLYGGFEATVIFRDEVRNPGRTIPRATYGVVAMLAGLYALTAWVFINSYGAQAIMEVVNTDPTGAATASVRDYTGQIAYDTAAVLLFTSSFALVLASHNITSRYIFNLSADRILHHSLSQVHTKHSSPHRASIAMSVATLVGLVVVVAVGMDETVIYGRLAGLYTYTLLILLLLVSAGIATYLYRHRAPGDRAVPIITSSIAFVVVAVALWLATANFTLVTGATGWVTSVMIAVIFSIIGIGMAIAGIYRRTRPAVYARIGREEVAPVD